MSELSDAASRERAHCVDALRFFIATTRGFRDRERKIVADYLGALMLPQVVEEKLLYSWARDWGYVNYSEWLNGSLDEWQAILDRVPKHQFPMLRDFAYRSARGSGRRPIDPFWIERIESEFNWPPKAYAGPRSKNDSTNLPSFQSTEPDQ